MNKNGNQYLKLLFALLLLTGISCKNKNQTEPVTSTSSIAIADNLKLPEGVPR